ncbi:MAG: hypothetical protein IAE82_04360 [Opitutaceae bacterium]|nr:hypothetical protein [Opitutaceae bacterium]
MRTHASSRSARTGVLTLGLAALLLAGCATVEPTWVTDSATPQTAKKIGVTASVPEGWARFTPDKDLVMTKDGFLLQTIRITRRDYGSKIENTDRTITQGMEDQEAAQLLLDAFAADQSRHNLQIVSNTPATIDGRPGFRIEVTYKTPEGLTIHETAYVALVDDSYVIARYTAPDRHYHEMHSGAFEKVVEGMKIGPMPGKKG